MMEILRKPTRSTASRPLDTPVIEAADVLLAKGGGETEKQIYRFQKGDTDLALRFDLTVPLAKYVALHYGELSFPFRRYQIGKVYRGERAQRGRFREFYQADIDIIGDGKLSVMNEAEIPSIIYRTFTALGLRRFQIRVNNRKILNGFYAMLGLSSVRRHHAHRGQARQDRAGEGARDSDGGLGLAPTGRRRSVLASSPSAARTSRGARRLEGYAGKTRPSTRASTSCAPSRVSGRFRRAGGEFRRRPHHRARTRLLHRHRL
jgi:hypothetical protein